MLSRQSALRNTVRTGRSSGGWQFASTPNTYSRKSPFSMRLDPRAFIANASFVQRLVSERFSKHLTAKFFGMKADLLANMPTSIRQWQKKMFRWTQLLKYFEQPNSRQNLSSEHRNTCSGWTSSRIRIPSGYVFWSGHSMMRHRSSFRMTCPHPWD